MASRMRKIKKEKTWNARPARRILFAVVGDLRFDSAEPMSAAPATWTIVATTSQVTKMAIMVLRDNPSGLRFWPIKAIREVRVV